MQTITKEQVEEHLKYNPRTGLFVWKSDRGTGIAGTIREDGRVIIGLLGRDYRAHRLAWLVTYGSLPEGLVIDHKNGNPTDNRIKNLRCVSQKENMQNLRTGHKDSSTGYLGVCWSTTRGRYLAQIYYQGKQHFLGYYTSAKKAHVAYLEAKREAHSGCLI